MQIITTCAAKKSAKSGAAYLYHFVTGIFIMPHIIQTIVGQNRFEYPSPNWKARTATCLLMPQRSARGVMIGMDIAACPGPEGTKKIQKILHKQHQYAAHITGRPVQQGRHPVQYGIDNAAFIQNIGHSVCQPDTDYAERGAADGTDKLLGHFVGAVSIDDPRENESCQEQRGQFREIPFKF